MIANSIKISYYFLLHFNRFFSVWFPTAFTFCYLLHIMVRSNHISKSIGIIDIEDSQCLWSVSRPFQRWRILMLMCRPIGKFAGPGSRPVWLIKKYLCRLFLGRQAHREYIWLTSGPQIMNIITIHSQIYWSTMCRYRHT